MDIRFNHQGIEILLYIVKYGKHVCLRCIGLNTVIIIYNKCDLHKYLYILEF